MRFQNIAVWMIVGIAAAGTTFSILMAVHIYEAGEARFGFPSKTTFVGQIQLNGPHLKDKAETSQKLRALEREVSGIADVSAVSVLNHYPILDHSLRAYLWPSGQAIANVLDSSHQVEVNEVAGDYFGLMNFETLAGEPGSLNRIPLGIVLDDASLSLAGLLPHNAVGTSVNLSSQTYRVIGVVKSVRYRGSRVNARPMVFKKFRFDDAIAPWVTLVIATRNGADVRKEALQSIERALGSYGVLRLDRAEEFISFALEQQRRSAVSAGIAAIVGLLIACVLTWVSTERMLAMRSRDFAIRLALGASAKDVFFLIGRSSLVALPLSAALGSASGIYASNLYPNLTYLARPSAEWIGILVALVLYATIVSVISRIAIRNSKISLSHMLAGESRSIVLS